MQFNRRPGLVAAGLIFSAGVASVLAQAPQETSVYDLVDVGPVPVPGLCSCIAAPFMVPYRPGWGFDNGAASPLVAAPLSQMDQRRAVEDRASLPLRVEQGAEGDANASLSIAMLLSIESAIVGIDLRTEEYAFRWLHLAAVQGHHDAFRLVGFRYLRGRGVRQDDAAAAYWFHQGATQGDPISMVGLGLLYAAGRGVPQDWPIAVRWWQRARARAPLANRFLGDAYACGLGVEKDEGLAVSAYKAAADRGELSSSTQLGHMYAKGCAEGSDEAALKAYDRAADAGYPEAQIALSDLIRQGRGADANPYRAYTWARLAELRLPPGELRNLAAERVKAAVRRMNPEALPAQEAMVRQMVAESARSIR